MEVFNAQLLKLCESDSEILFPACPVTSVELNPRNHLWIGEESNVGWQHDDTWLCVSDENFETIVLCGLMPLHVDEIHEISIVKGQGRCGPGSNKATSIRVAHADSVST